jgi:hypothetical protein
MPSGIAVTAGALRQVLGLAPERPEGVRDVLAAWCPARPVTPEMAAGRRLSLGDWPEAWRAGPESAPWILLALTGAAAPHLIAGVFTIDATKWGQDVGADPRYRQVPVLDACALGAAFLGGRHVVAGVRFGWPAPEENFAFL